ncbi:MAG: GWxTD domain-containing protein [Candidatus Aminicenantes bacterium]|nr:GWxTD domain-containing protein [Candidatus Aminicenantes bacterium]
MKKRTPLVLTGVFCFLLCFSCASARKESRLDPESEEFLSYVRYIITSEESRIFRELPPSARPRFIREFWERRDPTPETGANEFKETYFARIEEANRLFRGARPGWLQDRGRAFVLFGPPNERQTNPMGGRPIDPYTDHRENLESRRIATGEKPTEVWLYYNLFSSLQRPHAVKLVFVDSHGTGDYTLTTSLEEVIPGGLHTFINPDFRFAHELYKEEAERARLRLKRAIFDFAWEFLKTKDTAAGSNLSIRVATPYKKIIFGGDEGRFAARLELEIRIQDEAGKVVWEKTQVYSLDFSQTYIDQNKEGVWEAIIPVAAVLPRGKYAVYLSLKNPDGDQHVEKLLPLRM